MNIILKDCDSRLKNELEPLFSNPIFLDVEKTDSVEKIENVLVFENLEFLPFDPRELIKFSEEMGGDHSYAVHLTKNMTGKQLILISEDFQLQKYEELDKSYLDGFSLSGVSFHKKLDNKEVLTSFPQNSLFFPRGKFLEPQAFDAKVPALFLDRDGIINEDKGYVYKYEDIVWNQDSLDLIKYANEKDYLVFVLTNQSGISKGYYKEEDVHLLHNKMKKYLDEHKAYVTEWFYSPYSYENAIEDYKYKSQTRKPGPGMMLEVISKYNINLSESIMVGDKTSDHLMLHGPQYFHLKGRYDLSDSRCPVINSLLDLKKHFN